MTPSQTLLTKVKAAHGLDSDWQLHKVLGWIIRAELTRCRSPKRREILYRILARLEEATDAAMAVFFAVLMVPFY